MLTILCIRASSNGSELVGVGGGKTGFHAVRANSMQRAVLSNSSRKTDTSLEVPVALAVSRDSLDERNFAMRCIIGHRFENMPRRMSAVPRKEFRIWKPSMVEY